MSWEGDERKGAGPDPDETGRLDETQEWELRDETEEHSEAPGERAGSEEADEPGDTEEHELEEIVSAETQEWDSFEVVAEEPEDEEEEELPDEGSEPASEEATVVAQARSKVTSGFQAIGSAATGGFKAVGRHVRYPIWARFLTASFVIVFAVGTATAASLLLYLEDIGSRLAHGNTLEGVT
ncbi:MAG: hypothetical protein ACXWFH_12120, partial [Solirubrobacterales bacterium]